MLSTRSTTATRLSQRILVSTSVIHEDNDLESWDISGAFLKGLTFEKVREMLLARGIKTPVRKVAIIAPANVWRHLAKFDQRFRIDVSRVTDFVLICVKPVYGLSDAPLAWQLCLRSHFEEQKGTPSLMDENYFYWRDSKDGYASGVTTHVDDCGAAGRRKWLDEQYGLLVAKFGKVTRQKLPFTHCGVLYSRTQDGIKMSQDEFCNKIKMAPVPSRSDEDPLTAEELTDFRSILGGLLWLTATRLDLVADVCALQAQVTRAKVGHLKQANNVVKKAKAELNQNVGLHYRTMRPPFRLACVHDSSAAGNVRHYAQEGVLVMLCEDKLGKYSRDEHVLEDRETKLLGGRAHILWGHGAKAKRISHSTSHAETSAAISGLEASTLVAVRLAELMFLPGRSTLQALIATQEQGIPRLPFDSYTDCRDFFELASGDKSVSQDKNQRLYVLAFREARMSGGTRFMILCPTQSMTADALTKSMISPPLMKLLSCGEVEFFNEGNHKMTLRALPRLASVEEKHFDMSDKQLLREVATLAASSYVATCRKRFIWTALLFASMMPAASASSFGPTHTTASSFTTSSSTVPTTSSVSASTTSGDDWSWLMTVVIIIVFSERLVCQSLRLWWRHLFPVSTRSTTMQVDVDDEGDGATNMDVDEAFIGEGNHTATVPERRVSSLVELEFMLEEIRIDRDHCREMAEKRDSEIAHLRALSENRWNTIARLTNQLESERARQTAAQELYVTSATCKVYHRNRQCYHIRTNSAVKTLKPCQDCCERP